MSATTEVTTVERELAIAASPETVWEFLVDPEKAVRWMGTAATFEVQPGGIYRVEVVPGNTAVGKFVEIDPPHRLVYSWGWESGPGGSVPPGSTTVEFDLMPNESGTLLRFRHSDLPSRESGRSHAHGWDHYFERLVMVATGEDPEARPMGRGAAEMSSALAVALAYHEAWSRDFERAMTHVADDIVCDAPAGRIEGAEGAELIAAFGDEETALVMYDTDTVPVKGAPGAECVAVKDGRIVRSRFVFDREPFLAPAR